MQTASMIPAEIRSHVPSTSYIIVNNLGGITSLIINLIRFRQDCSLSQELILLDVAGNRNSPAMIQELEGVPVKEFPLQPKDNWYHVYGQLANIVGHTDGVLVSNDVYDLIMLTYYNVPKKVVQIVHDAYNIKLAIQFESVVDVFICHSFFYYEMLCQLLNDRRDDIFYIPYGIPLPNHSRSSRLQDRPLKLLFLGRHEANKGVFDLYEIHRSLLRRNIPVNWLILGKGPETGKLKEQWQGEKDVNFSTPSTSEEVLRLAADSDILVFPTKFEGFPVALVESMGVGCVPVVSDLPGGIREIVQHGESGFRCKLNDVEEFADFIEKLHFNRNELDRVSVNAYEKVRKGYDAVLQSPKYHDLFARVAASGTAPRHHQVRKKLGSRLDQPWLPNAITQYLRKFL